MFFQTTLPPQKNTIVSIITGFDHQNLCNEAEQSTMAMTEQIIRPALGSGRATVQKTSALLPLESRLPLVVKLYFVAIFLPIEFNVGSLLMSGVRSVLLVVFIPMLIRLLTGKCGRLIWTDLLFFLFCLWNIYTLYLNNPDQAASFGGSVALEFYGGYLIGRTYIRTPEAFAGMCKVIFAVVALTIPFAIFESQTGRALIPETLNKIPGMFSLPDFYNEWAGIRMGLERSQAVFEHPIHYGLFCSTAFSLAYVGFKGVYSTWFRYLISYLIIFGVFLSLSSGAILPMVLHFGLIFWAWSLDKVRSRWIILMVLTGIAYVVVDAISNRSPIEVFLSYATFSPHTAYWRVLIFEWGMKNVWMNPLYGLGLNDWVRPWWMHGNSMDNFFLLNAVRYGIPGFLLITVGLIVPIWNISRLELDKSSLAWKFRRAWVFTWFGLIMALCTVDIWSALYSYVAVLFGSGMWFLSIPLVLTPNAAEIRSAQKSARIGKQLNADIEKGGDVLVGKVASLRYTRFDQSQTRG